MRTGERVVDLFGRGFGAVGGRHARRPESLADATGVTVLAACLLWLATIWRQTGCLMTADSEVRSTFLQRCYTDMTVLYTGRGLLDGNTPYIDQGDYPVFEYPTLTGMWVELMRLINVAVGAPVGPGLDGDQTIHATNSFVAVNMVALFVLLIGIVVIASVSTPGRPWDGMMVAIAPVVMFTGAINWDFLPVALTAAGILAWARRAPTWAGALLGLGMAAKLYPLFLLGPLFVLCLLSRRMVAFAKTVGGFVVAWLIVNGPVFLANRDGWLSFWEYNSDRQADLGSIWYVLSLAGYPVADLNLVWTLWFIIACAGIAALCLLAPQRPRFGQVAFLVISAFLVVNKVYSPQYVLWLLPLFVLARPKWREWVLYMTAESLYVMAIWADIADLLNAPGEGPARVYWLAVLFRIGVQLWLSALVCRDILRPGHDPIRAGRGADAGWTDDPHGGVLDGAPDAAWAEKLRRHINAFLTGTRSGISPLRERQALIGTWLASRGMIVVALIVSLGAATVGQVMHNWDADHYIGIAENGYEPHGTNIVFFPGLPMVMKLFMLVGVPAAATGVAVALVASGFAAWALYRLGGLWAAGLWLIAPPVVFLTVPYAEAPFCAFAFWAWERARRGAWWQAALFAAGACTFRVSGLFLIAGLGILALTYRVDGETLGAKLLVGIRRAVWLLIPAAVVVGFVTYLYVLTGSWTAWIDAQQDGWSRGWHWPWQAVANTFPAAEPGGMYADQPGWGAMFRYELVSTAVGLVASGFLLARRRFGEATYIALQVLSFMTSYWLFSVNRAVLLWFPVWIIAAEFIAKRPRSARGLLMHRGAIIGWVLLSLVLMVWWARMYFSGQWAS